MKNANENIITKTPLEMEREIAVTLRRMANTYEKVNELSLRGKQAESDRLYRRIECAWNSIDKNRRDLESLGFIVVIDNDCATAKIYRA